MKDRGGQGTEEKGGGILLRRGGRGGLAPKPKSQTSPISISTALNYFAFLLTKEVSSMFLFCCVLIFVSINPPFDSLLFQKHFRQNRWISVDVVSRQLNCVNVYYSQKHSDGTNYTR